MNGHVPGGQGRALLVKEPERSSDVDRKRSDSCSQHLEVARRESVHISWIAVHQGITSEIDAGIVVADGSDAIHALQAHVLGRVVILHLAIFRMRGILLEFHVIVIIVFALAFILLVTYG